jgi:peroxiredoxin
MAVTDAYKLRHVGGRAATGEDKPYPTTFVVDAGGVVRAKFENETHRVRPEAQAVLVALVQVTSNK